MTADPRIDRYDWAGGREAMLRFGPDTGPIAVMALPLLEEANRTRAFAVAILRALADRGVAGVLPDIPGQGESLVPLETVTLAAMRSAHQAVIDGSWEGRRHSYAVGIRSGALLDVDSRAYGRWHLSPQTGSDLLRELTRVRQAALGAREPLGDGWLFDLVDADGADIPVEIAGNRIGPALLRDLLSDQSRPYGAMRTVRLATDPAPADRKVDGPPLWRRSEPGSDPDLAACLADDIAEWISRCEG